MKKPIEVLLLPEAEEYFDGLNEKIKIKFFKAIDKTKMGLHGTWFKSLNSEIWEFRERDHQKFYRILAFWDKTGETNTLILATHGFNKKTNKTPPSEIKRSKRIRKEYFRNKNV